MSEKLGASLFMMDRVCAGAVGKHLNKQRQTRAWQVSGSSHQHFKGVPKAKETVITIGNETKPRDPLLRRKENPESLTVVDDEIKISSKVSQTQKNLEERARWSLKIKLRRKQEAGP